MACAACIAKAKLEAKNAADRTSGSIVSRIAGHGRKAHGRDAGRRRQNAEENHETNLNDAWDLVYEQTYNRVTGACKHKK